MRAAFLALVLLAGCGASGDDVCFEAFLTLDLPLIRVGERVPLALGSASRSDACQIDDLVWTVDDPAGHIEPRRFDDPGSSAEFHADRPGAYRVRVAPNPRISPRDEVVEATVTVYAAEVPLDLPVLRVRVGCHDAEVMGDTMLCIRDGVRVVDLATSVERGRSDDTVPARYGLATGDGFFATGAFGDVRSVGGGLRLYEVVDGQPVLQSFVEVGSVEELAVEGDQVALTLHSAPGLRLVDVRDRRAPRVVGCGDANGGVPVFGEGGVWVIDGRLSWFPFADLSESCALALPRAVLEDVPYFDNSRRTRAQLVDGRLYVTGRQGIRVFDVRDPLRPTRGAQFPFDVSDAVVVGARLYALDRFGTRLLMFDLNDGDPKLIGDASSDGEQWGRLFTDGQRLWVGDGF